MGRVASCDEPRIHYIVWASSQESRLSKSPEFDLLENRSRQPVSLYLCLILDKEQRQITIGIGEHRARLTLGPRNFVCPGRTHIEEMGLIRLDQGSFIPEMLLRPGPGCKISPASFVQPTLVVTSS